MLQPGLLWIVAVGVVAGLGSLLASNAVLSQFEMYIDTPSSVTAVDQVIPVSIRVESSEATNVFSGILKFNPEYFTVEKIDYNTSLADIWAVEPWYSRGEGTINFAGGTTNRNGFVGNENLLTVTFRALQAGQTDLGIQDVYILRHDGLGTEVDTNDPIDLIFTIEPTLLENQTLLRKSVAGPNIQILEGEPDVDLNGDGKISTPDYSIFMVHLSTQNLRSDFNGDGKVTIGDLSVLARYR